MSRTTTDSTDSHLSGDWREFDDRDAHQDRIARDLIGALAEEPGL